jgi:hypothetical protein
LDPDERVVQEEDRLWVRVEKMLIFGGVCFIVILPVLGVAGGSSIGGFGRIPTFGMIHLGNTGMGW